MSIRKTYPMQAYKIMHGLWGMGQMMFTKYIIVVGDDVDMHNTSEVIFRLCANTDPPPLRYGAASPQRACRAGAGQRRDNIFIPQWQDRADVLDPATSKITIGSKPSLQRKIQSGLNVPVLGTSNQSKNRKP